MASFFANSSTIGVDLNNGATTAQFTVGSQLEASSGSEWVYVEMGTAASAGTLLAINATNTATLALPSSTGSRFAFAQATQTSGNFAWVCTRGNPLTVLVSSTSSLFMPLYVTAASGALSTTASSGTMAGITLLTASTTAVLTAFQAVVTWPKMLLSGGG